jgi:hypothetical protein
VKILARAQIGVDGELLWHIPDRSILRDAAGCGSAPGDDHLAGIGLKPAAADRGRRRVARTVWAEPAAGSRSAIAKLTGRRLELTEVLLTRDAREILAGSPSM